GAERPHQTMHRQRYYDIIAFYRPPAVRVAGGEQSQAASQAIQSIHHSVSSLLISQDLDRCRRPRPWLGCRDAVDSPDDMSRTMIRYRIITGISTVRKSSLAITKTNIGFRVNNVAIFSVRVR